MIFGLLGILLTSYPFLKSWVPNQKKITHPQGRPGHGLGEGGNFMASVWWHFFCEKRRENGNGNGPRNHSESLFFFRVLFWGSHNLYMDVSKNNLYPKIIHFYRVFHDKPSILGYHDFWKQPYNGGFQT